MVLTREPLELQRVGTGPDTSSVLYSGYIAQWVQRVEHPGVVPQIRRFGLFEVDLSQGRLTRRGAPVKLQEQPLLVLAMLLERPGEIVSREALRHRLWPQGTHVDFDGSLNAVLKRLRAALRDDPDQPRFIETVPKRGYRFIAPVISAIDEPDAARASAAAAPFSPELGTRESPGGILAPTPVRNPVRRIAVLSAVLLVVLGGSIALRWLGRGRARGSAAVAAVRAVPARKSVAVLGFQNSSGNPDDAWLSTALSQMLSTELAAGDTLRLVSGEDIANLRASSPWSQTDTLGRSTASRIGTALNSDLLVLGSYAAAGKAGGRQIRLDARLQDARTGEILEETAETGSDQNPFELVSRIGGRMRGRLGVPALTGTDEPGVLAALPSNGEAARYYAQGLMRLREFDAVGARDFFQQVVAVDPQFPLGHSMLAQAWGQLGYDQKCREEAKKALDLSANLPRADRMLVEGAYYESLADPEKAVSTYRALFTMFPDSVDYGLRLVTMLDRVGRQEEALETIQQLHRLPPPVGDDARLDIWEAKEISTKNGPESVIPLQRGMSKAAARGQKLIYADAKANECVELQYSEHPDAAIPACQEAYDIFLAAGNRKRAASALRNLADRTSDQGRKEEALRLYDRAIRMLRETGSRWHLAAAENNMAIVLEAQGQLDRAERLFRDVKRNFEEVGDKGNIGTALDNIADVQMERGDLGSAAKTYEESISVSASPDRDGYPVYRLANLHRIGGSLQEAHQEAERAIKMFAAKGADFGNLTEAMSVLGDVLREEGDLAGARRQFQESLATRLKLGNPGPIAQTRASLASLSVDEDRASEAEADLRGVLPEFEKEKDVASTVAANIDLSRALMMQGKVEEARKRILLAKELWGTSPDPVLKLNLDIQDARVELATPGAGAARRRATSDARGELRSVIATARRRGYLSLEYEARLALGELEMQANPPLGRSELETLARQTRERRFGLISREAAGLLNPPANAEARQDSPLTRAAKRP
jgi:DNA-binding winged helix-turn-helix (wHTH) protein/tetratricopeptide (TPR) repeat protein